MLIIQLATIIWIFFFKSIYNANLQFYAINKQCRKLHDEHDNSYKQLFSHPRMVEDLLRGFIPQKWVKELDFNTLEKASGSYVSDDLREREDDIIWKVRWHHLDEWLYIYLLTDVTHCVSK